MLLSCVLLQSPAADDLPQNWLLAWSFPPAAFVCLAVVLLVYWRGWTIAHRTRPHELPLWRAVVFSGGIAALWTAIASPIDALDDYLLAAHMIQHFILMSIAPPLIVLGAPTVPLLNGVPRFVIRWLRPAFQAKWVHRVAGFILHPLTAWLLMNLVYLGWHVPAAFELTFQSEAIHQFEHACFFFTSLCFWWVVIAPWPARIVWPRWSVIPYLLGADILNTLLSAILAFSGRVLYPSYAHAERISNLTPLQDQVAAGAEMWVLNSTVMLIPALVITLHLLSPRALRAKPQLHLDQRRTPGRHAVSTAVEEGEVVLYRKRL
jgi:putative membrane protein